MEMRSVDITVATWNTEWKTPASEAGRRITAILEATGSDVIVVTEGVRGLLPDRGYAVDAGPDWGYAPKPDRRKVIIWSPYPLRLDFVGAEGATRGRLAVATATLPTGPVRIVGVCIPWRDAHVDTGRRDAQRWSEHMDYLDGLEQILPGLDDDIPTVIAGDFNQRIPRNSQPVRVAERLHDVLADWTIHTAGDMPNGPHIDHIATNRLLTPESVADWPASDQLGRLSDHAGVTCRLRHVGASKGGNQAPGSLAALGEDASSAPDRVGLVPSHVSFTDEVAPAAPTSVSSVGFTSELRAEIEGILRRSSDGLEHGATFRLQEQGLTDAEIAVARGVKPSSNSVWLRSLKLLLSGELPTSKSAATTNSYGYRELLNHPRSDNLDRYVMAQLRKLKERNPDVRFDPLNTRPYQYRLPNRKPKREKTVEDRCAECGTFHSGGC